MNIAVEVYAKIYTDTFPAVLGEITTNEFYQYLSSDCSQCFNEELKIIPGDKIIWYLGCNEKVGYITISTLDDKVFECSWGMGESSFKNVRQMLHYCQENNIFTIEQYDHLLELVIEGEQINSIYLISKYLKCKYDGKTWIGNGDDNGMRKGIKDLSFSIQKNVEKEGFKYYEGGKDY